MKIIKSQIVMLLFITVCLNGYTQGFANLDFEDATIVPDPSSIYYPNAVYTSDAVPGWTVIGNFMGPNDIFYNDISLGAPSVALLGNNGGFNALDGAYSIDLYGGSSGSPAGVSISQTALVPADASSIGFIAQGYGSLGGPLLVSLGGQNISFSAISTGPNYTSYAGSIPSGLAGQVAELTFSTAPDGGNNYWEIDDIQFSSVPEPGVFGLFALGGLFFGLRRRQTHSG